MNKHQNDVSATHDGGRILSDLYTRLVVENTHTGEKLIVIEDGDTPIKIFDDDLIVRLTPRYD